ncbi:hypothetical protein [Paraburkholderia sediminicola]|uniref:hypothetical protein n=1 Tax=Paraburkholderia sediminicola TaxID=458836 RepID=UPI0038B8E7F8
MKLDDKQVKELRACHEKLGKVVPYEEAEQVLADLTGIVGESYFDNSDFWGFDRRVRQGVA